MYHFNRSWNDDLTKPWLGLVGYMERLERGESIDRPTQDVDLFSDQEMGVAAAAQAVEDALRKAGFQAERRDTTGGLEELFEGMGEGLAEWIITAAGGQQTMLQMAYFDRSHGPVTMDVGPVLDLEDLAAGQSRFRRYVHAGSLLEGFSCPFGGLGE